MKIEFVSEWNDSFFERFLNLKNHLFENNPDVFVESIEDLKKFFAPHSPITQDYQWQAYLVSANGKDISRGVLSFRKDKQIAQVGFLEFENNAEAFKLMMEQIITDAKSSGITELRGPTNINFFVSYRWKLPGGGKPFYSEPVVPDYYHDFIKAEGFTVSETWDTFSLNIKKTLTGWKDKIQKISQKKKTNYQRIELRCIRPWKFDQEIEIIHKLFVNSYSQMSEYDPIDLAAFKLLYSDFKYIINPLFSYIAYHEGEPVGFCFNFFDPLPFLRKFSKKSPSSIERALLLTKIQSNKKRLLIMYSGKVPAKNGDEIKGLQIKVSTRLTLGVFLLRVKEILVCFQSENSPSKRSFDNEAQKSYSKYVMYRKSIENN